MCRLEKNVIGSHGHIGIETRNNYNEFHNNYFLSCALQGVDESLSLYNSHVQDRFELCGATGAVGGLKIAGYTRLGDCLFRNNTGPGIYSDAKIGCLIHDSVFVNSGGAQTYGVQMVNGSEFDIHDNRISAHTVAPLLLAGALTRVHNNTGYNPRGNIATPYSAAAGPLDDAAKAQAFPTSATLYTVRFSPKLIVIGGGTITNVQIDGIATGQAGAGSPATAYRLEPGQTFLCTWTVQPTINGVWAE
jgi:hypothetical protein